MIESVCIWVVCICADVCFAITSLNNKMLIMINHAVACHFNDYAIDEVVVGVGETCAETKTLT